MRCAILDDHDLDHIQVVKGRLDEDGRAWSAAVLDVAVFGDEIGPDGRCKTPVGSTIIDMSANADYTNTIGAPGALSAYWKNPSFDATKVTLLLHTRDPDRRRAGPRTTRKHFGAG